MNNQLYNKYDGDDDDVDAIIIFRNEQDGIMCMKCCCGSGGIVIKVIPYVQNTLSAFHTH